MRNAVVILSVTALLGQCVASPKKTSGAASPDPLMASMIVGGTRSTNLLAPFMAQLENNAGGTWGYICACVVLDATHILTAASCVGDIQTAKPLPLSTLQVRAGSSTVGDGGQVSGLASITIHPKWTTKQPSSTITYGDNDVAVLKMRSPVRFGRTVQPARLPKIGERLAAKTVVVASSWGVPKANTFNPAKTIRTSHFNVIDQVTCDAIYKKEGAAVSPQFFCVGSSGTNALCSGDSGTALTLLKSSVVYGIYSWGTCGAGNLPAVIVNLGSPVIRSFIDSACKK